MHNPTGAQCRGLAFGIIALGVCAALLFLREPHSLSASPPALPQQPIGVSAGEPLTLQVVSPEPAATTPGSVSPEASAADGSPPQLKSLPTLRSGPPPDLPKLYAPAVQSPAASPRVTASGNSPAAIPQTRRRTALAAPRRGGETPPKTGISIPAGAIEPRPNGAARQTAEPPGPLASSAQPLRHRVRDGDSLESLAEKYLGDRARWAEIFAANPRVLSEPGLLPIGAELVIPGRTPSRPEADKPSALPPTIRRLPPVTSELVPLSDSQRALLRPPETAANTAS